MNTENEILYASPLGFALHEIITDKQNNLQDYRFIEINQAFEKLTGLKKENIIGKTAKQVFKLAESSASVFNALYDKITASNGYAEYEQYFPNIEKQFKINAYATDEYHIAIVFTEISTSKHAKETVCLKELQQHVLWNNNFFGMMITDRNGNYIDSNEEACRMTGYSCEELKKMSLFQLIAPERIQGARNQFEQLGSNGKAFGEVIYFTKNGEKRWWNIVATKISEDYFLGLHEDITCRKMAEEKLREKEEHYAKVISNINDVIWEYEIDSNGKIIRGYISPVIDSLLKLPHGSIGNDFEKYFKFIHPDDLQIVQNVISSSLLFEEPKVHNVEYRVITGDGNIKNIRSSGILYKKPNGISSAYGTTTDISELKLKEEELLKTKSTLTAIIENTYDNIWAINANYEIIYMNENFRQAFLKTLNVQLQPGSNKLYSLPENMVPVWKERYDKVLGGKRIEFTETFNHDGNTIYIELAGNPIIQDGFVIGASFFGKDITKRKMMEQELSRNVEFNRKLLASIPDVVIQTNIEGIITFVNEPLLVNYPFITPDHLLGKNILSFVAPNDLRNIEENFRLMFDRPLGVKEYLLCFDNKIDIQCEVNGDVIRDENNNPTGMVFVIRDITKRKKAEQLLIESEERFRLMIKNISAIIVTVDKEGIQQFVSPAAERITGYSPEELMGKSLSEVIHPEDLPQVMKIWNKGINKPNKELIVQYRHIHKTKGWVYLETVGQSFLDEPSVNAVIAIVQDISERMNNEAKLRREYLRFQHLFENSPIATWLEDFTSLVAWFNELRKSGVENLNKFLEDNPDQLFYAFKLIHIKEVNNAALVQNAALSMEELVSNMTKLFQEQTFSEFILELEAIWQGHDEYEYESFSKKLNGEPLNVIVRLSIPKHDGELDYSRVVVTGTDITERKRVEQSLRENELKFRTLFENSGDAIFLMKDDIFIDCNLHTLEIFGCQTPEQIIGHAPFEFSPESQPNGRNSREFALEIIKSANSGHPQLFEWMHTKQNGIPFMTEVKINQLELNNQIYLQAIVRDITQRKQYEEELIQAKKNAEESERKHRSLIETMPNGYYRSTPEGYFVDANPAFIQMLGYDSLDELKNIYIPDELYVESCERDEVVKINPEFVDQVESYRLNTKHGDIIWIEDNARYFRDENNSIVFHEGICKDITERKIAEEELRRTKDTYESIFNSVSEAIYVLDENGTFIDINLGAQIMYGYNQKELTGKTPKDVSAPDMNDMEAISRIIREVAQTGIAQNIEFWGQRKNGEIFPKDVFINRGMYFGKNHIIATARDITERKRAEVALKESEEKFRALAENVPGVIYLCHNDENWSWIYLNDEVETITGYKKEEFLSNQISFADLYHPDDKEYVYTTVKTAIKNNEPYYVECRILDKNNSCKWIEERGVKLVSENNIEVLEGFISDITQRKHTEEELILAKEQAEENEEKYKQIFDNTFDIMSIYEVTEDQRYKVVSFNPAEAKLIGDLENYQNRYVDECIPPELYNQFKQNYENCIREERRIEYDEDITFLNIRKTFKTQLIPLKNASGRIHRIIVISRDITENKLLNTRLTLQNDKLKLLNHDLTLAIEKAEESDRLKSAFLANMSHEIRTPMNGILGFAYLLKTPGLSGDEQQEYIRIIEKSGHRMLNIINDIVDISKIEVGLMELHLSESNITEQIEYIHAFFKPEIDEKGLKLLINNSLANTENVIITDNEKLAAILTNLVKNAIKFTEKGEIEIGCSRKSKFLEFYIKDTGIGIPEARHEAIFERFVQADIEDKMARQGAGLGLAISKAYIEMMGGRIWVESTKEKGSVFFFTLPFKVKTKHI